MDCAIIPTRFPNIYQISTTDFFYPLVEDPYLQGKIACANVLSDLYAAGVVHCDNILMLLGVCDGMSTTEKDIVTRQMMKGFYETAKQANSRVTGGQTVINAWPLIGGCASTVVSKDEYIAPSNVQPNDIIVLTKPLGIQLATNLHQWIDPTHANHSKLETAGLSKADVLEIYNKAIASMIRLNLESAKLMHKYKAHAATDVTGFGILGHLRNLAKHQDRKDLEFKLHTLPLLKGVRKVVEKLGMFKSLFEGFAAETSGGLMICFGNEQDAKNFCEEIEKIEGQPAWIIGKVFERDLSNKDESQVDNTAKIQENPTIIEV